MFSGICYRSPWLIALAVYYILLAVMRFLLIRRVHTQDMTLEFRRYRLCGIILLLMNQALVGIVIFMVQQNKGFDYPGLLIYGMALFVLGIVIGIAGIVGVVAAYPVYAHMAKRKREKLAPEIMRLTEELMK